MAAVPSFFDESDDDFLSGEGAVDTGARVRCPYCAVLNDIFVDLDAGYPQEYQQDCAVCRRPLLVRILSDNVGQVIVEVSAADDP